MNARSTELLKPGPRVIAHRGMSTLAPENTIAAFTACAEHQVKCFECDVDIISDGTIVVCHDDTLNRTTNRQGPVYDLKGSDLAKIDAGSWFDPSFSAETLPHIAQLCELIARLDLQANIEIKPTGCGAKMAKELVVSVVAAAQLLPGRILVSSFSPLLLNLARQLDREIPLALLIDKFYPGHLTCLELLDAQALHMSDKYVTEEIVSSLTDRGYTVNVWTVNDTARAEELFSWGVSGVFTDLAQDFPAHYRNLTWPSINVATP